ncbi:low temperature requirement protein A [Streptomyces sp. G-G2]|uniref:low temperature requirement protein A n=1 Tax=Streptomyces sp. G-G2 TaxID=3046201 RepID=UPI0024B9B8B0|nr:low temperature requirement protein A [Streptomyces sp. G-G2]MDJ0382391.1 low temperature requirement protein A [Streptomyces sp. G-G2]
MTPQYAAPAGQPPGFSVGGARHASWLELFFDLIAVAGVAQLAHLLHGAPGRADLGLYCVLYLAFWTAWMCFTTYGNVAADKVRTRTVLIGMFGLAVMAAAVPEVRSERAAAFALAYVLVRVLASRVWQRRGEVPVDWPMAQLSAGVVPWIVSLWAQAPTRYWLWAAGLLIDLGLTFALSRSRVLARAREGRDEHGKRRGRIEVPPVAAPFDPSHLDERLGLFTLIVLGEGIAQGVEAASETEWTSALGGLAVGAFVLLLALWALAVRRSCGVPLLGFGVLTARFALPLHCVATSALAALAASLGAAVEHVDDRLPAGMRWLMCGSLCVFLAVGLLAGALSGRGGRWVMLAGLPMVAAPLLLAAFAGGVSPGALVWTLVLVARWPWLYEKAVRVKEPPRTAGGRTAEQER